MPASSLAVVLGVLVMAVPGLAAAACDVTGADAGMLAAARAAVDAACPCAEAIGRGPYRRCANDVVRVRVALECSEACPYKAASLSDMALPKSLDRIEKTDPSR
jgi:hypothetical protein